jgi:hypothetical protein
VGVSVKRPTDLDAPRAPLNHPPTRAELSGDLVRLAVGMGMVAVDMEYLGGFGELAAKGRHLRETALIARGWAGELRRKERK